MSCGLVAVWVLRTWNLRGAPHRAGRSGSPQWALVPSPQAGNRAGGAGCGRKVELGNQSTAQGPGPDWWGLRPSRGMAVIQQGLQLRQALVSA